MARRVAHAVRPSTDIVLVCDEPKKGSEVTLGTVVSGWAYSAIGIREISIWLEGQPVAC